MSPVVETLVQSRRIRSNSNMSEVKCGRFLDSIRPPKTYSLSPRIVVVAPTNACGSFPVHLCTLHTKPERFVVPLAVAGVWLPGAGDSVGWFAAGSSCLVGLGFGSALIPASWTT